MIGHAMLGGRRFSATIAVTAMLCLYISGCSTAVVVENTTSHSLNLIRKVLEQTLPGGVRFVSENGRQYASGFFSPTAGFESEAADKPERAYARVLVLGDRRPYRMEVFVFPQIKTTSGYQTGAQDKRLATELARRIEAALAKSREDRNVIDDFRAF